MLRTRVVWTGVAGTPYYTNLYWAGVSSSLAEQAHEATENWKQGIKGAVVNDLTLTTEGEVVAMNEATGTMNDLFVFEEISTLGSDAAEPLPFQVQYRTRLITGGIVAGRRVAGSIFQGGVPETANTTGVGPNEANRAGVEVEYSSNLIGTGPVFVVWSKPFSGAGTRPARAGSIHPVQTTSTSTVWSQLRSRRATD